MSDVDNSHTLDKNDLIAAATKLWDKPTSRSKNEWRFGTRGSKSIRLDKLLWHDHETGEGGGIVDLCKRAGIIDLCKRVGINRAYHTGAPKTEARETWVPSLDPPAPAPINLLTCDKLFTYRCAAGNATHYVKRFERPRKFLPLTWGKLNEVIGWHLKAPRPPLPLYGLADLRDLDPELILLVEGEKAADAANAKIAAEQLPWLAMSWYGGAKRAKDASLEPLKGRKVVIWPDADKPGLDARDTLMTMLPGASALDITGLPEKFDAADLRSEEKIGEWVKARMKAPEQPATVKTEAAKELPPDISIDDFYAYLPKHWYLYVPTQTLWPPATIGARLKKVGTVKAARWLDKERAVSQMIWAPGEPQIVKDKHLIEGGWINKPGAIVFNQYHSPKIEGGDPAAAGPWLDLVKYLWPTPSEHEHIIRVLAHKIQFPNIKINHALVLGGGMRIGKDTVLVPIKKILGEWNCTEAKPTTIMSSFNGYMRSTLLLINEARDLGEVKRHEFYLHMKDVIAAPPNTVLVNEKHEKGIHVANVCLVIMTTNHRTDGIYLPSGDGRHFPVWSERQREDYELDYFDRFYDWLNSGGTAHVAAYLRSLDVSAFRPGRPPEKTELFHEIVAASRPVETTWLEDILVAWANELSSPPVFILDSLKIRADQQVKEWLSNPGNRKIIPYRLEECGYTRIPRPGSRDGRWKVANVEQNIYGPKDLNHEQRLEAAQVLARGTQGVP